MSIKGIALHRNDGSVDTYRTQIPWESMYGALGGSEILPADNLTFYNLDASGVVENSTLTIDYTKIDIMSGQFKVSLLTGENSINVQFVNAENNWFCVKADAEFLPDSQTVVLEPNNRYVISYFERHITVEKYIDPSIGASNDSGTGDEEAEIPNNPKILWVYKSGDADFSNYASYSDSSAFTIKFPPFEEQNLLGKPTGNTIYDCVQIRYDKSDSSPSSFANFAITLDTTFENYSKLYIEAKASTIFGYAGGNIKVGYVNKDEEMGDELFASNTVYTKITGDRAKYEFDISALTVSNKILAFLTSTINLRIYNIWLEP